MNFDKKNFYPIFPIADRLRIVGSLSCVDQVFIEQSLALKRKYIIDYQADCLVMGDDWKGKFDDLKDLCEVIYLPRTNDISTSALKERLKYPV